MNPLAADPLRDAIDRLYRVFAASVPPQIEGCPCCLSTRNTALLLTTPLRQLTGDVLWRYVSGVFLTVRGPEDFRYLLPRIFEISVRDPATAHDPEIVLGKLRLAQWRYWSRDEQAAIETFVSAWFEQALSDDGAETTEGWIGRSAESLLCGAAGAGMPLERWRVHLHAPSAATVLADLRRRFPHALSTFWEEVPSGLRQLSAILGAPAV